AGEPGDDPQLRRPVQPRPAQVLLTPARRDVNGARLVTESVEVVHYRVDRAIATVELDSPDNRNALSAALVAQLTAHLETAAADDGVRAVVLTHTGSTFCAGADLRESAA